MNFKSEVQMTNLFLEFIEDNILTNDIKYLEQVKGLFGIPDFVLIESENSKIINILSIELKLKNWKRALEQAFKYKNFSNQSYVIFDEHYMTEILKKIELFKKFNIGLASFNKNKEFKIYHNPNYEIPYSQYYLDLFFKITSLEMSISTNDSFSNLLSITNNYNYSFELQI